MLSDNSGYYIIMRYSDAYPRAMKYLFSTPTSNQNYKLVGMISSVVGTLKITDTEFFWISFIADSFIHAVFVKFTAGFEKWINLNNICSNTSEAPLISIFRILLVAN